MNKLYKFPRLCDGKMGFVLTETRGPGTGSEFTRIAGHGVISFGKVYLDGDGGAASVVELPEDMETIEAMPTPEQCGTTNAMDYEYRRSIGNPVMVYDLVHNRRLMLLPCEFSLASDGPTYMLRVVETAISTGCYDSLMKALVRLCCRDDVTIVMSPDSPVGSFFWFEIPRIEHNTALEKYQRGGKYEVSAHGRYHGGLIGHTVHKDGAPTMAKEWSVHT